MRKSRYIVLAVMMLAVCGVGFYYLTIFDPDAPRTDWPVLQAAATAKSAGRIVVGPNVHVSASMSESRFEFCDVSADPEDPTKLFSSVLRWRDNDIDLLGFYSHNGGATWKRGCELLAGQGERLSDSSVSFGPNGLLFLVHMRSDSKNDEPLGTEGAGVIEFHASTDGGKTWVERAVVTSNIDRPWIVVDTTRGPNRGQLYCVGNIDEPIIFMSTDGAKTFSAPLTPLTEKLINCRHANPVVMADGTVVIVYEDRVLGSTKARYRPRLLTLISNDGGSTLTECSPVNTKWWHETIQSSRGTQTFWPRLAADPGSKQFKDRVYCVWGDGNDAEGERIFFSASSDHGNSWTQPVVISEQPMQGRSDGEYMTFKPSIAVNKDGVVAVSWYDRRGLPKSRLVPTEQTNAFKLKADGWNVRLRVSLDGGATWLPSVQVTEQASQGEMIHSFSVGHAAGLASGADGRFHAVWIDNRTGKNQLWTATVKLRPEK